MTPHQEAADPGTVSPFTPGAAAPLRRLAGAGVWERWHAVDRSAHAPHLVVVPGEDGEPPIAGALVTARPGTAYVKIVDTVGDGPAAVRAVLAHARRQGLAQVKWEGWTAGPREAAAAGFAPLGPPLAGKGSRPVLAPGTSAGCARGRASRPRTTARAPTSPAGPSPPWSPGNTPGCCRGGAGP